MLFALPLTISCTPGVSFIFYCIQNTNMLKNEKTISPMPNKQGHASVSWRAGKLCMSVFHRRIHDVEIHLTPKSSPAGKGQKCHAHSETDFLEDEMFTHTERKSYYRSRRQDGREGGCWGLSGHGMTHRGDMTISAVLLR